MLQNLSEDEKGKPLEYRKNSNRMKKERFVIMIRKYFK